MKAGYLIIIFAAFTAACTPRFYPPRVSVPDDYIYGRGFSEDTTRFGPEWWTLFGDTVLNNLVARALDNNRDVAVAASRVEEARLNLKSVRAQYLPQVGLGVTAEGEYTPATKIVQSYAVEPSLSWEVALFGQLRNAKRAAKAQIASSEWALRGVRLALAAEVATTYFTLLEYERDLAIARRELRPAARIGGPDRLDVPLRHVGRRGAGAGPESGLHRRSGHSAVPAGRGADAAVTRHPAGRNAAANGQRGGWTASADRLPSGGHSRRTALGAARTAARHHAGALRHARRSRRSGRCPRQPVPVHCSDGQRWSSLQFDQRFNFGQPLGVGCVRLADAPRL